MNSRNEYYICSNVNRLYAYTDTFVPLDTICKSNCNRAFNECPFNLIMVHSYTDLFNEFPVQRNEIANFIDLSSLSSSELLRLKGLLI